MTSRAPSQQNGHQRPTPTPHADQTSDTRAPRNILITAGPTHEPIDAVRFIGNRSSGKLGVALAHAAAKAGWNPTLLLGQTEITPTDSRIDLRRFRTVDELDALLRAHQPDTDVLVMAAAVSDYRVRHDLQQPDGKLRRTDQGLTLHLEPTPDLVAGCVTRREPHQIIVGFALEPRDRMLESANDKLRRKELDLIVANPLDTLDSDRIEATVLGLDGSVRSTGGPIDKQHFALWLLTLLAGCELVTITPTAAPPAKHPNA